MRCIDEARKQGGQAPSDRCILGQARDLASMCKNSSSPMYMYTDHLKKVNLHKRYQSVLLPQRDSKDPIELLSCVSQLLALPRVATLHLTIFN